MPNSVCQLPHWEDSADFWDEERKKFSSRLLCVCSKSWDGIISRRGSQTKSSMSSAYCVWSWMIYESSAARWTCTECEGLIHSSAIEEIYRDDTYLGTELWNEAGSVNFYWETSPFHQRCSVEKHFHQFLLVLAVARAEELNEKGKKTNSWWHMRGPNCKFTPVFWLIISVTNKKCSTCIIHKINK